MGFDPGKGAEDGTVILALESSIGLLRAPATAGLSPVGHIIVITLRIAGPVLVALTVLSIRGRVKR